jgi:hypothetical protein
LDFKKLVSAERFNAYRVSPSESEAETIKRYLYNTELCSTFYIPLHIMEIGLRNTLNYSISQEYGVNWLTQGILHDREQNSVEEAIQNLKKRKEPCHTGKIIAELTFGFWASLLYQKYDAPSFKIAGKAVIWPYCIKETFPYMPKRDRTRKNAEKKIEGIRKFRNRIFHHEPIWKINLIEKHNEILEVISWFYKDYNQVFSIDMVKSVLRQYN